MSRRSPEPRGELPHVRSRTAPAWHAGPPRSQGGLARAASWLRHPASHQPDLTGRAPRRAGSTVSGAVPPRASGPAQGQVGHLRKQPPRQVLRAHGGRAQTARRGNGELESARGRYQALVECAAGGRMRIIAYLRSLAFRFLHRQALERELDDELRSHVAHRADDLQRAGLDRGAAERQARVEFGGHARFKDEARDALAGRVLDTLVRDLRFSVRQLRKSRSFTIAAVVTLAVAIGANAVAFGAINGFILRPLGLPHEETLFTIERASNHLTGESYPNYVDLRDRVRAFDGLAAFIANQAWFDAGGGSPTRAWVYEVSGNYFDVLGIRPYLGR